VGPGARGVMAVMTSGHAEVAGLDPRAMRGLDRGRAGAGSRSSETAPARPGWEAQSLLRAETLRGGREGPYRGRRRGTKTTGMTLVVEISPEGPFSMSWSCWTAAAGPTGTIMRPPRFSCSSNGGGM
jgi:hypothetical protein